MALKIRTASYDEFADVLTIRARAFGAEVEAYLEFASNGASIKFLEHDTGDPINILRVIMNALFAEYTHEDDMPYVDAANRLVAKHNP